MPQSVYAILPSSAALGLLLAFGVMAAKPNLGPRVWIVPAILSILFFALTIDVIVKAGPLGFWSEHLRGPWGAQIWCDLLLAAGTAVALLLPRARAVGMRPIPWILAVLASGSIGLLAMTARCLFLESRRPALSKETAR
ncbi:MULTISPECIES: hypothetical protein [unclassified Caulobacter]|jgi:hypothetical protein|uniref:hypothetical protein n=1 Tax=unclassified Caulobacter TaxID=2648921 RepID=UPI0009E85111|nr:MULTISPECIES: hypothetical protein [unclassified Caulobacter]AZS20426.1 hypothetical protein CSW63_07040 [Caulobacter sp. FWC26]